MSYDRGTTTKRTERRLAKLIEAIARKPQRQTRAARRRTGYEWHGVETYGLPNRAHRRRGAHGSGHMEGHLPAWEATCRARGERRRQRAHRRRMARR